MRRDDDRFFEALKLLQDGHHLDARAGVEPTGRFVEQENLRIVHQHAGEADALLHAAAERPDQSALFFTQADQLEHVVDRLLALGRTDAVARREKVEVLGHLHVLVHAEKIRHVAEDAPYLVGLGHHVVSHHPGRAGRGRQEGGQDAQRGGFAGAVRADEPEQVPLVDREVEGIERGQVAVVPRKAERLDGGVGDRRQIGGWFV